MRRLFWLAMGVTVGALLMRKLSRLAEKLTPRGVSNTVASSLADLAESLRYFGTDVRAAMAEREAEIRENTGLDGALGRPDNVPNAGKAGPV